MKQWAKNEIPHEELKGDPKSSACYTEIGSETQIPVRDSDGKIQNIPHVLHDKVIYKFHICPYCGSNNTFHKRIQDNGDKVGNVWRTDGYLDTKGHLAKKFDYCLDCRREFIMEIYIWKRK